ncbi:MAG: hypothetical protein ABI778_08115, partial [Ignavibacteriota bacterium]
MKNLIFRFRDFVSRIPLGVRFAIVVIVLAMFHVAGMHGGLILATALAAAPGSRVRGSGNEFQFNEIDRSTAGVFTTKTAGTDFNGDIFDTWHILGSHTESPLSRDDNGLYKLEITIVENDLNRMNFLQKVAPFNTSTTKDAPELNLEDGTQLEGAGSSGGITTQPYYKAIYAGPDSVAGKKRKFYGVGQFGKATQLPFKFNEWNVWKVTFY